MTQPEKSNAFLTFVMVASGAVMALPDDVDQREKTNVLAAMFELLRQVAGMLEALDEFEVVKVNFLQGLAVTAGEEAAQQLREAIG